ncbi:MAG: hypothetical protein B7733_08460 [Myxococcales bacterium FL481]|nr:MAG: hypothetical protein B7733_08460 [Myxococcales bacterium FL481]
MAQTDLAERRGPDDAVATLERALRGFRGDLTVADAAARSGLSLRDAERGLQGLVARYRGHLAATTSGELLFRFPRGLVRPREHRVWMRALTKTANAVMGVGRFLVRAWVSVVAISYAVLFAVILIALAARSEGDGIGTALAVLFRIVAEALFWTFHPFSPFRLGEAPRLSRRRRLGPAREDVPFYEKVNRFVFGPPRRPPDPLEQRRGLIAEIRHQHGRVGIGDVMRVTGLPRGEADALMSKLMIDLDGEVSVTDDGAIVYTFRDLRRTAALAPAPSTPRPVPYYQHQAALAPVTGNPTGSNVLFAALNGFNLVASATALANGLTLERLNWLLTNIAADTLATAGAGPEGLAVLFGVIPLVFSLALFVLPLARVLRRPAQRARIAAENGRRRLAALVLAEAETSYPADKIEEAFAAGAGRQATQRELLDAVWSLGGQYDLNPDGEPVYRFEPLATEQRALVGLREEARATERSAGEIVFSSDA